MKITKKHAQIISSLFNSAVTAEIIMASATQETPCNVTKYDRWKDVKETAKSNASITNACKQP